MKRHLLLMLLAGFTQLAAAQNDPIYNQYQFNQLLINPAYAGANDRMTASVLTRLQWVGMTGAPVTTVASLQSSFKNARMGLGIIVVNDRFGVNNNNEVNVQYSYRIDFGETKLQFGLQGGFMNYNYDYSKLNQQPGTSDPALITGQNKFTKPNIGSGLFLFRSNFFVGLSVPRLVDIRVNDGGIATVRYRRTEYLTAGYVWTLSEAIKFKPSVLLRSVAGAPLSMDVNANLLLKEILWVGLTLRNTNALALNTQLEISDRVRFGYAYEYPFKPINSGNYGTHELMLSVDFMPFRNQLLRRRYF